MGFVGTLSGDFSVYGKSQLKAARLAARTASQRSCGDYRIVVRAFDTRGNPQRAEPAARRIVGQRIVGVLGPTFSGEALAAGSVFDEAGVPFLVYSATNPQLGDMGWKSFFRLNAHDGDIARAAAKVVARRLGLRRLAVVSDGSAYGDVLTEAVNDALRDSKVNIVMSVTSRQPREVGRDIARSNADGVFFGGYPDVGSKLIAAMRRAGGRGITFVGSDAVFDDTVSRLGSGQGGIYALSPGVNPEHETAATEAYVEQFDEYPAFFAAEAYTAMLVFAAAFDNGVQTNKALKRFLRRDRATLRAMEVGFKRDGEARRPTVYLQAVRGDVFRQIASLQPAR